MPPWRLAIACLALLGLATATAAATDSRRPAPVPPCVDKAGAPSTRAGTDPDPVVTVWHAPTLPENWQLASCSGLQPASDAVLIEIAGRFHHDGDARSVLARLGAVSTHTGIVYWDVGGAEWRQLLPEAVALAGPELQARRADFSIDEMQPGARLNMLYDDDEEPGPVVFETEVREAGPDGFVTVMRNVSAMTLMGFSIADPGDISSMLSLRRVAPGEFDYYALTAVSLTPMAAALTSDADHVNRAVASYRFLAGIPGDRDPPTMLK